MNRYRMTRPWARAVIGPVIALAILTAACSGDDVGDTADPPVTTGSPSTAGSDSEWGPLAVVPPSDGSDGALIQVDGATGMVTVLEV